MLTVFELLAICFGLLAFYATCLWLGARWARIIGATWWKALGTILLLAFVLGLLNFFSASIHWQVPLVVAVLGTCILNFFFAAALVKFLWKTSLGKAIRACLPLIPAVILALAVVFGPVRRFLVEGFVTTSNSNAPTLVSLHYLARCPHCGGTLIVPGEGGELPTNPDGICSQCQKTGSPVDGRLLGLKAAPVWSALLPPDRILVNKLLTPRRWDLVAFRSLNDPKQLYVKRIIGLPGEEVVLKGGAVWINGKRLAQPFEIGSLDFTADVPGGLESVWGSPPKPARLGSEDYFVIGDFAARSADCRTWGQGLPRSHITGVVSLIYLPLSRWRIFR
jgi:signal peptidase I